MNNLDKYRKFAKARPNANAKTKNLNVWLYTRVSSASQKDNYSLDYQRDEAYAFAQKKGLTITREFGKKNESASSDFTRKEFSDLINEVKKEKVKPFAIMVYIMNRFSRSGGGAVAIADELINKIGVHLIEVCSGLDTSTDDGRLEIYDKLLEAKKQNNDRLKHTIPGMKRLLKAGKCLGNVPFGYTQYGPRVKDFERRAVEQRIIINEDGKKLKLAWEWKVSGMPDHVILTKLRSLGVNIRKQKLSAMWNKPFYCGIQTNKLLDGDFVRGNWEVMVSEDVFWKVQSILEKNHNGYCISKEVDERPLVGSLYCSKCGKKLTGYLNRRKNLHYYKCQTCSGVTINANTPRRQSKNIGAHDVFVELLNLFSFKKELEPLFNLQLKKILTNHSDSTKQEQAIFKKRLTELNEKREKLNRNFAFGDIGKEMFDKYIVEIDTEIHSLQQKYQIPDLEISNLDKSVKKLLDIVRNISKYWKSASVSNKKRLQELLFPQGLVLDTERRQYLTSRMNSLFMLKLDLMGLTEEDKKKLPIVFDGESDLVAGTGLEPVAFGL
ncbi:serine type site-specific recombinase [Tenuifilaceae bacterium CYCD]|nr:serine type site-specific recombinase [Tenuifilaceae bacterium CYCD]